LIRIEFRSEDLQHQQVRSKGGQESSAELLEENFFNLPVRFNVNGVELFEKIPHDSTVFVCQVEKEMQEPNLRLDLAYPEISVPLLHLATVGLRQVRKACLDGTNYYHLPGGGYLEFSPKGDSLNIYSSISQRSASANCSELQSAFEDFKERIRQFITEEIPDLIEHPSWKTWFGGE
jgi:hypothetical protein